MLSREPERTEEGGRQRKEQRKKEDRGRRRRTKEGRRSRKRKLNMKLGFFILLKLLIYPSK